MSASRSVPISTAGFYDLLIKIFTKFERLKRSRYHRPKEAALQEAQQPSVQFPVAWDGWEGFFDTHSGSISDYFGVVFNDSKSEKYLKQTDNLRGCIYQYITKNIAHISTKTGQKPASIQKIIKGDHYARNLWRNIALLADTPATTQIKVSEWALSIYEYFIDDDQQWQEFQKKADVVQASHQQAASNWHQFHCFFSGDDTGYSVQSFRLFVNICTHAPCEVWIPRSAQNSEFKGALTIGPSGHYAIIDLQSNIHKRPLRMLIKKRSTENGIEEHELMLGMYMFINKDGEALNKGYLALTCDVAAAKTEKADIVDNTLPAPVAPDYIRWALEAGESDLDLMEDTIESLKLKYEYALANPSAPHPLHYGTSLKPTRPYFQNTYWRMQMRTTDGIHQHIVYISDQERDGISACELFVHQTTHEDYYGSVGFDGSERWLVFNLFTKDSIDKSVHIKMAVPGSSRPTLMIGQVNYISTANPTQVNSDLITMEKLDIPDGNFLNYLKKILYNSDEYQELPEEDRRFFENVEETRLCTPSRLISDRSDFKQQIDDFLHERRIKKGAGIKFPANFLNQNFYIYTLEILDEERPCLVRGLLSLGKAYDDVKITNPREFGMDDYEGNAYLSPGEILNIELWPTNGEPNEPSLHLQLNIRPNETFKYSKVPPEHTIYFTGAYLVAYSGYRIRTGTIIVQHVRQNTLPAQPVCIFPGDHVYQNLNPYIKQYFGRKEKNLINIPGTIFTNNDWNNFFREQQTKDFTRIKKGIYHKWLYIAAPASGLSTEQYEFWKGIISRFADQIKLQYRYEIFAPFIETQYREDIVGSIEVAKDVVRHIKKADRFILFYPEATVSSSLIELGMALAEHHKIHIFVHPKTTPPYLLRDLMSSSRVTQAECSEERIFTWLKLMGSHFFEETDKK